MNSAAADYSSKVIVVASPKGGCAKTTTVVGLAGAALERGLAVQAFDTDVAQHFLTDWLGGHDRAEVAIVRPECESAWNKAPVFGVIGVQTGPL